jgi:uncharacterized protein (DUF3820 family)
MKQNYNEYEYTKMPFGKYKNKCLRDIPDNYLKWGIMNIDDVGIQLMFSLEYQRRYPKMRK